LDALFPENGVTEVIGRLITCLTVGDLVGRFKEIMDMEIRSVGIDLGKTTFIL
jgi:hypothetical protein